VNNGGGSDTHCFETKIKAAIVKLTNTRIARFERNIKLFSRYEAKIACRVGGVKCGVAYFGFGMLLFDSSKEIQFSRVRVNRLAVIQLKKIFCSAFCR